MNEALNLHYCFDSDEESPCSRHINDTTLKTAQDQKVAERKEKDSRDKDGGQKADGAQRRIPYIFVKPTSHKVSYKDTLLKQKPSSRGPPRTSHIMVSRYGILR